MNRLSIGVQSFDDAMLKALGRIHAPTRRGARSTTALEIFDNVNLDLMYGLPGQTLARRAPTSRKAFAAARRTSRPTS